MIQFSTRLLAMLGVSLVLLGALAPLSASAQQGKGNAVQLCQKGGFREIQRDGGVRFANQKECITHVAQGGTVTQAPSLFLSGGLNAFDGSISGTGFSPGSALVVSYTYRGAEWVLDSAPTIDGSGTFTVGGDLGWCVDAVHEGPTTTLTAYDAVGVVIHSETVDLTRYCADVPAPSPTLALSGGLTAFDGSIIGAGFTPGSSVTVGYTYRGAEWVTDTTLVNTVGQLSVGGDLGRCVDAVHEGPTTTLTAYDSTGGVIHSDTVDLTRYCS